VTAILDLVGLSKSFGAVRATDALSLAIEENELHAIIGPNGAGKTTLIGQITGEIASDRGCVLYSGTDITSWTVARRALAGLARSFQITTLISGFSAQDNVSLAVQARSGHSFRFVRNAQRDPQLQEPARSYLAVVGLEDRRLALVEELSHGEHRQLEIAVALAMEPRVLILDEPMAGMGAADARKIIDLLRGLKGQLTIVLIEHDMEAVFKLADRVTVLVSGRTLTTGSVEAVRADPAVRQAYLGEEMRQA
jgi:branched-chain amino acid transport system ATP-binding protein